MAFGISGSGAKIDKNCAGLETARSFASVGSLVSYCKVMVNRKYAKEAGVTLEDCMTTTRPTVAPTAPAPQSAPAPITIILPPTPVAPVALSVGTQPTPTPAPAGLVSSGVLRDLGEFTVTRLTSTGTCPSVAVQLGTRGINLLSKAIGIGGEIILTGETRDVAVATGYLKRHGVTRVSVRLEDQATVGVSVWEVK
jgi:hypothetical protein